MDDSTDPAPARNRRRQADRRQATELAIRNAGLRLFGDRGFHRTTANDIAAAAGVSKRTLFNYFASKEEVLEIPRTVFEDTLAQALRDRPIGEEPATSVAAAVLHTHAQLDAPARGPRIALLRNGINVTRRFSQMQLEVVRRRTELERVAWQVLLERGTRPDDQTARTAVTIVMALGWEAMQEWARDATGERLHEVMSRWLLGTPGRASFAPAVAEYAGQATARGRGHRSGRGLGARRRHGQHRGHQAHGSPGSDTVAARSGRAV